MTGYTLTPLDKRHLFCTQSDSCEENAVVAIHLTGEASWGGLAACADHHPDKVGVSQLGGLAVCSVCRGRGYVLGWVGHWGGTKSHPIMAESPYRKPCPECGSTGRTR